jgi:ribosome biogenesis protein MAK21
MEKSQSKSSREFVSTVLKSGTVTDKISALTLLIQESPLHSFKLLSVNLFQNMAAANSTGNKRNVSFAVDALKDLLLGALLPDDRKLK